MAPKQRRKRELVHGLLWLAAGRILFLVLLPVWFPWLLTLVAGHYGVGFVDYERMGWTRFAVTGVHGVWGGTRLEVQRAESVLPTMWLWRRFSDRTNKPPLLSLRDGQLMFAAAETNAVASANTERQGSAGETLNQISRIGRTLQKWLPMAALTNCAIQVASNLVTISQAEGYSGNFIAWLR